MLYLHLDVKASKVAMLKAENTDKPKTKSGQRYTIKQINPKLKFT